MRKLLMVSCAVFGSVLIWPALSFAADWVHPGQADHEEIPIVVSLGDSYSSGEGLEPYYGQNSESKYRNEDWICHRSQISWPGMLKFNGVQLSSVIGTNYNCADGLTSIVTEDGNWYFGAVSGAVTSNIYSEDENDRQVKEVYQTRVDIDDVHTLNFQLGMITSLPDPETVDYVTMTIGGNDVGFTEIVTKSLLPDYINLSRKGLKQKLIDTVDSFWVTDDGSTPMAEKLENTYRKILDAAPNAKLIVAGYPKLIYQDETQAIGTTNTESFRASNDLTTERVNNMFGVLTISESEARLIDEAVSAFDTYIGTVISQRMDGENITFVDVQDVFAGHEAYSDEPYLEGIVLDGSENVNQAGTGAIISSASFHPNEKGAEAYAQAVQEVFTQYDEDPVLSVCDENGNVIGNYTVQIEGYQYTERYLADGYTKISSKDSYSQTLTADSTDPLQLSLKKGDYTITIIDSGNPENTASEEVKVRKNYDQKNIQITVDFEKETETVVATDEDSNRFSSVNDERWKNVYRDYIKRAEASLPSDGFVSMKYYYSLVYIDGDDVPELYIEGTYEAEGDRICTITKNGTVAVCWLNRCFGSYYKEKSGRFCNFNGNMGHYDLDLYTLENGTFIRQNENFGSMDYENNENGSENEEYFWNGASVSVEEFYFNWNTFMGQEADLVPWDTLSYPWENLYQADEILEILS